MTVTTVEYGDVVPETPQGRFFGGLAILLGIALFSMITAAFAAYFISQKNEEMLDEGREQYGKMCNVEDRLFALEKKLDQLIDSNRNRE